MIHYINNISKKLVGRNNQQTIALLQIDNHISDEIEFQIVNPQNQIQTLSQFTSFTFSGALQTRSERIVLFSTNDFEISEDGKTLKFTYTTNTTQFLANINKYGTNINVEISARNDEKEVVLLRDYALANPRVQIDGFPPVGPLERYFTKNETKEYVQEQISSLVLQEEDPLYNADKPNIIFRDELTQNYYSKTESDERYIQEESDPVYNAEKSSLALKTDLNNFQPLSQMNDYYTKQQTDAAIEAAISGLTPVPTGDGDGYKIAFEVIDNTNWISSTATSFSSPCPSSQILVVPAYSGQGTTCALNFPTLTTGTANKFWTTEVIVEVKPSCDVTSISVPNQYYITDEDNFPAQLDSLTSDYAYYSFIIRYIPSQITNDVSVELNYSHSFKRTNRITSQEE